jgi:arginine deiminase
LEAAALPLVTQHRHFPLVSGAPQLRVTQPTNRETPVINMQQLLTQEIERAEERERFLLEHVRRNLQQLRGQRRQLAQLQDELAREAQPAAAE